MITRTEHGARRMLGMAVLSLAMLSGCTPADPEDDAEPVGTEAVMEMLRNEAIIEFTPSGVEDEGLVVLPAEGIDPDNWISRKFLASSDEALMSACAEYFQAALDHGWVGPEPADSNSSGISWTVLSKDEMELGISCVTSQGADLLVNERDEIRMTVRLSTSSTSGVATDDGDDGDGDEATTTRRPRPNHRARSATTRTSLGS